MLMSLIALDERVFQSLHHLYPLAPTLWRLISYYSIYLVPFLLIWFWFVRREAALFAVLAGSLAWQGLNNLIGHFIDRARPLDFYQIALPGNEGLFHRPGSSFPSDHTAFLTGITVGFWVNGQRRAAQIFGILTLVTVLSRIVTGQHWPGDIIAGLLVGIISVGLLLLVRRPLDRWVINPLVKLVRRFGL